MAVRGRERGRGRWEGVRERGRENEEGKRGVRGAAARLTSMADTWWMPSWEMVLAERLSTCRPSCCSAMPAQM